MFSMKPWAAAGAAVASPFLSSVFMSGYEQRAYIFLGYGLWTQLFAMWCLPIAWGLTWRAINSDKLHIAAGLVVGLTICLHFETGYLALLPLIVFPWIVSEHTKRRILSAIRIAAGAFLVSAWAWVPVLAERKWSAINSVLAGTQYQKGYGATAMLKWLAEGRIFDSGAAMPIVTLLGAVGLVVSIADWRRSPAERAMVSIAVSSFLLELGLTTFGPLADLVPGHQDIYFRRFAIGIQLAWLLLAGNGLFALAGAVTKLVRADQSSAREWTDPPARQLRVAGPVPAIPSRSVVARSVPGPRQRSQTPAIVGRWALAVMIIAALASGLGAAVARLTSLDFENGRAIANQVVADRKQGPEVDSLVAKMKSLGPGRVYAGTVSNWGSKFKVGIVPVFKYLETQGVDVMVYSATTTTLMDDPQYYFNERIPADYALLGVKYLLLPTARHPLVPARFVASVQKYSLWQVDGVGYSRVVDTVGSLDENRADIGPNSRGYVDSPLAAFGLYLTVAYEGEPAANPTAPNLAPNVPLKLPLIPGAPKVIAPNPTTQSVAPANPPGSVVSEVDDLDSGEVQLRVDTSRRAVVALSVTYDPGWTVWVDGHRTPTEMLAPALLGVTVGPGSHTLKFDYVGYPYYGLLFAIAASVLVAPTTWLIVVAVARRRRRSSGERESPTHPA